MIHIRQKNSSFDDNNAYVIVNTEGWENNIENHPSILEHSELFEIVNCDIPFFCQYLNYISEIALNL